VLLSFSIFKDFSFQFHLDSAPHICVFPIERFVTLLSNQLERCDIKKAIFDPVSVSEVKIALNEATLEYNKFIACLWHQQVKSSSYETNFFLFLISNILLFWVL